MVDNRFTGALNVPTLAVSDFDLRDYASLHFHAGKTCPKKAVSQPSQKRRLLFRRIFRLFAGLVLPIFNRFRWKDKFG